MHHHNDTHVIVEEDRAGNLRPVLAPLGAVACRDCGRVRYGVTVRTFVCRFCLSLFGAAAMRRRAA